MRDMIELAAALVLVMSPLLVGALCVGAQLLLGRRFPALAAILPLCSAALLCWFPEGGSWLFRGFYVLDSIAALAGSLVGALAVWLMRREQKRRCGEQ